MDYTIITSRAGADMTWEPAGDIMNNIWLSLHIQRGAFFACPWLGSRLHLLRREKVVPRTVRLAQKYAEQALQWIIDLGRAKSITVLTEADKGTHTGRVLLHVEAVQADGRKVTFSDFVEVV